MDSVINETREVKSLPWGDLIIAVGVAVISTALVFWKTSDVRQTSLEIRMTAVEQTSKQVLDKLDKVQEGVNDVKLSLKDKQDRK